MIAWLAESAVVCAAMVLFVLLLCRFTRPRPAVQHVLWLAVLLKALSPPVVQWPWSLDLVSGPDAAAAAPLTGEVPRAAGSAADAEPPPAGAASAKAPDGVHAAAPAAAVAAPAGAAATPPPRAAAAGSVAPSWRQLLIAAWGLGALVALLYQARSWRALRRLLRLARPAPAALQAELEPCARRLGLTPPELLLLPAGSPGPFVHGLWRPRLYWPADLPGCETAGERRCLFAHELAHVRRRDHLLAWLEPLALAVAWWNPLVAFARRRMREAAEWACDSWVVWAWPEDRRRYAEALIDVSSQRSPAADAAVLGATGACLRRFERRLAGILTGSTSCSLSLPSAAGLALFLGLALPGWSAACSPDAGAAGDEAPAAAGLDVFEAMLEELVYGRIGEVEGAGVCATLFRGGELLYAEGRGLAAGGTAPAGPDEPHPIGSLTGTFTATLLAALRDEGLLGFDQPLGELLPELRGSDRGITPRHLLEHTSGLRDGPTAPPGTGPAELVARLPAGVKAGVECRPSLHNYALAGAVAEAVTGAAFPDLLRRRVLEPLGLGATDFAAAGAVAEVPALGLSSTAADLVRFLRFQLLPRGGPLPEGLLPSSVLELQKPSDFEEALPRSRSLAWQLGWLDGPRPFLYRTSQIGEYSSYLAFSPDHKVGLVLLGRHVGELGSPGYELITQAATELSELAPAAEAFRGGRDPEALALYGRLRDAYPHHGESHYHFGYLSLVNGDPLASLPAFRASLDLGFRPSASAYNLACGHSLLEEGDAALGWLELALELGFHDSRLLATDRDLEFVRGDPRFAALSIQDY